MAQRLKEFKRTVGGAAIDYCFLRIDGLFFKDPDGLMIEIYDCEDVKLVPPRIIAHCPNQISF